MKNIDFTGIAMIGAVGIVGYLAYRAFTGAGGMFDSVKTTAAQITDRVKNPVGYLFGGRTDTDRLREGDRPYVAGSLNDPDNVMSPIWQFPYDTKTSGGWSDGSLVDNASADDALIAAGMGFDRYAENNTTGFTTGNTGGGAALVFRKP